MTQYVISPAGPPGKNFNNLFIEKTSWNEVSSVENNTKTSWYTIKSMRKFFLFRIFVRNFSYLQKSIGNFSYKNRKKKHCQMLWEKFLGIVQLCCLFVKGCPTVTLCNNTKNMIIWHSHLHISKQTYGKCAKLWNLTSGETERGRNFSLDWNFWEKLHF